MKFVQADLHFWVAVSLSDRPLIHTPLFPHRSNQSRLSAPAQSLCLSRRRLTLFFQNRQLRDFQSSSLPEIAIDLTSWDSFCLHLSMANGEKWENRSRKGSPRESP